MKKKIIYILAALVFIYALLSIFHLIPIEFKVYAKTFALLCVLTGFIISSIDYFRKPKDKITGGNNV